MVPDGDSTPIGESAPVAALTVKAETLFVLWFATYRNDPLGEIMMPAGVMPVANGDPAIGVNAPVDPLIANA